jgi:hypothetical protein
LAKYYEHTENDLLFTVGTDSPRCKAPVAEMAEKNGDIQRKSARITRAYARIPRDTMEELNYEARSA